MENKAHAMTSYLHNEPGSICDHIHSVVHGSVGMITLARPQALNALNLPMIRELTRLLNAWQHDDRIAAVAIRGSNKTGPFGAFCAGGDIRFFHQAAWVGDPALDDFFTEEYALNHAIHAYPKPYLAVMDGIVMGGGMGISQGARLRIVTEQSRLAMPETQIGLFPDVGGSYFLSRCPGAVGEYLALTGASVSGVQALSWGLADHLVPASCLPTLWGGLPHAPGDWAAWVAAFAMNNAAENACLTSDEADIHVIFSAPSVPEILNRLTRCATPWARETLLSMERKSPLMMAVVLEQIRRGRQLSLADNLRMERGMVRHCFHTRHLGRFGASSETVEGIRALAVDKDHKPRWNPALSSEVTPDMVMPFFHSPWPDSAHPLRHCVDS
jgi:enoyl-CoA hydratase/carnithine racemase